MSFILNKKIDIPPEHETKIKILSLAQIHGCLVETKRLYDKYEENYKRYYQFDDNARLQMAASLIKQLSEININLVLWLADDHGNIHVNNEVVFTVVDVPEKSC